MTRTQRRALQRLYTAHLTDDGWLRCTRRSSSQVQAGTASSLVAAGFARYLPGGGDGDKQYVRITLAGVAALNQRQEAA